LSLGVYFLYQDIQSLLSQKKSLFENSVRSASLLIPPQSLRGALATKNSQSPSDSQLFEALKDIQTDLNLNGHLHILKLSAGGIEIIASTDSVLEKGELLPFASSLAPNLKTDLFLASDLRRSGLEFRMFATGPLYDGSGYPVAHLTIDANESAFAYQLVGYLLHYLFIAAGLTAIALVAMSFSQAALRNQAEKIKETLDALFENAEEAVVLMSPSGKVLQMNTFAQEIFEDSREDFFDALVRRKFHLAPIDSTGVAGSDNSWIEKIKVGTNFRKTFRWGPRDSSSHRFLNLTVTSLEKNQARLLIFSDSTKEHVNQNLQHQLITDPLTKTLNKAYLTHFLDPQNLQWIQNEGCSMLIIDLDNFKNVNDSRGHSLGDLVLQNVGTFLRSFFRKTDKVIRFGGDEFVILLPGTQLKEAARIAQNFIESFRKSPMEQGLLLTASVGVAQLQSKESGKDWLERADAAMYDAKHSGKNSFRSQSESLEILN